MLSSHCFISKEYAQVKHFLTSYPPALVLLSGSSQTRQEIHMLGNTVDIVILLVCCKTGAVLVKENYFNININLKGKNLQSE